MLRCFRLPQQLDHVEAQSPGMDEPNCDMCWHHWKLYGRYESCLEFLVCLIIASTLEPAANSMDSLLRLLLGVVIAGMWPGMSYYLTLFYPPSRTGKRIGYYFTAAQLSAAVVGLVSAGFQEMDGLQGLVGFQWMFLLYGLVGICCGISLLWWLPDRPTVPGDESRHVSKLWPKWLPKGSPALSGEDARIHYEDLTRVYHSRAWGWKDLLYVLIDWRLWPLVVMYFGVVGVGIGVQNYGTVIIRGTNPELSGIELSLLFAPIWIVSNSILLVSLIPLLLHR